MGNVIQTNVSSLNSQRNLYRTNIALGETFQRLSSGFRINSAKDDAAGLQIANQLTSQVRGLTVAIRNANDGLSVAQVAEGAQQEITNILQRMRELALSAANGTTSDSGTEKQALDAEFQALKLEIERIANSTKFGSTNILQGNVLGDADLTAFSRTLQVGSSSSTDDQITISITDIASLESLGSNVTNITTAALAIDVLQYLDSDITTIDSNRAALGAIQNRLTSTIANLSNVIENASAARSRLRDADYALETSNLAKNQVLQQAGLSVLSQANAQSQSVLSLLQG